MKMTPMDRFTQVCAAPNTDGGSGFDKVFSASTDGSANSSSSGNSASTSKSPGGGGIKDTDVALKRDTGADGGHTSSTKLPDEIDVI